MINIDSFDNNKDNTDDLYELSLKVLMGDVSSAVDIMKTIKKNCKSIPDKIFYRNLEMVMKGMDEKKTSSKKVAEKLARCEYGSNTGVVLLKYIYSFEIPDKGKCMAYLMDAVSKDFIHPIECMRLCKYINNTSLKGLLYLTLKNSRRDRELISRMLILPTSVDEAASISLRV